MVGDLIWILDCQLKELLVVYEGNKYGLPVIIDNDSKQIGYHFKFWRAANEEDTLLMPRLSKNNKKKRK